jgi:arsenate reductase
MHTALNAYMEALKGAMISEERKARLAPLIRYVQQKLEQGERPVLQFICTHNSRRSQFAQLWAHTASAMHGVSIRSLSGGTEATAFHPNTIASAERAGFAFRALKEHDGQTILTLQTGDPRLDGLAFFSKRYDDPTNEAEHFAAVMTCADADENCPFIPGTEARIALNYDDPKAADGTDQEAQVYDQRQKQIAAEMYYVFSVVAQS